MMRIRVVVLSGLVLVVAAAAALAEIVRGTIQDVSSRQITVTVPEGDAAAADRKFNLTSSTRITLDRRRIRGEQLELGHEVTIFTDRAGAATQVRAQSRTAAPAAPDTRQAPPRRVEPTQPAAERTANARPVATDPDVSSIGVWPQFRGPNRDNISRETGLLERWPADGPPLAWTATGLGQGYSTVSVDQDLVFTMGNVGADESVLALGFLTGDPAWSTRIAPASKLSAGDGPRSTPTVDGDRLYALGGNGDLACLQTKTGDIVWQQNILQEFDGRNIGWGICESVLIDGDKLICTPGGRNATVVALDKASGRPLWRSQVPGNPQASYASAIIAETGGIRQYVLFTSRATIGVRANDGRFLWSDEAAANGTANCSTPLFHDGHVFSASGYSTGGALLKLVPGRGTVSVKRIYKTDDMKNHHGGMIALDGHLYGSNDPGILMCLELLTGKVAWRERSVGKGSVAYADGHIYLRSESGPVALVEATPDGYREKGRFNQPQRSGANAWPHPVVAAGRLFLRDQDVLLCYDVKDSRQAESRSREPSGIGAVRAGIRGTRALSRVDRPAN